MAALLFVPLVAMATNATTKTLQVVENKMIFTVNGKRIAVPNFVVGGVTYVPIRAAAEALGKMVGWDGGIGVSIDDPVETTAPNPTVPAQSALPAPSPSPAPVVMETSADRVLELIAWLKNERSAWWYEPGHFESYVIRDRATMEIWKGYFAEKQGNLRYETQLSQDPVDWIRECGRFKKYADDMTKLAIQ